VEGDGVGRWGISEQLRAFVEAMPYERHSIIEFVREVAESLPPRTVILDVGAGNAPYRELFDHCEYLTADWEQSPHEQAREVDVLGDAAALPLTDDAVDAALLTQVLEHVVDPAAVLREMSRVLRPGGGLFLTVPFVWELHEMPFDFWRFTPFSLEQLLSAAGFRDVVVAARTDCFTTTAQLLQNLASAMGRSPDGRDAEREAASALLEELSSRLATLAPLDSRRILPLGWNVRARYG
jgi:ubiquinone/menaquinone biosynthesis C-methylase UbiE